MAGAGMRFAGLSVLTLAAACGGGGGGSSGGSGGVVIAPGPTSTPIPVPTPSPTPSAASYQTYAQLTGDQRFATGCAALQFDASGATPDPVTPFGTGLTLGYTAATQTYLLTPDAANTGIFGTQPRSYGPADRDATAPAVMSYARTVNGFQERLTIGSNVAAGASPDYVRGFSLRVPAYGNAGFNPPAVQYMCIFGVPTRIDDPPATTQVTYTRTGLNAVVIAYPPSGALESFVATQSQVSVSVDLATNRVSTTIHLIGQLQTASGTASTTTDLGTYTGTATIDSRGFYRGDLTSSDRMVRSATFGGWFFGPQAAEAAFSIGIESLDQTAGRRVTAIGNVLGLR